MVNVLLVDDDHALIAITKTNLERIAGLSVQGVTSPGEARDLLKKNLFDVIVSDYDMPGENGLTFLKDLRKSGNTIPFIIITGRGCEEVAIEALNSGADYYLQKSGNIPALYREMNICIEKACQKKKAEQNLIASEKRYRAVVESQKELICRYTPDLKLVFANEAFCRYYDIRLEDQIGSRFIPHVPRDDRKRIRQHIAELTPLNPDGIIENRVILPDGTTRWQQWSNYAIFEDTGMLIEYQSVGRDITEKKELEISATEHFNHVRALMDTMPAPVFYRDIYGVYKDCNQAFEHLVGMKKNEIIGKKIHDFFPKDLADHYRHMDDLIIEHTYIQQYEYSITNTKGKKFDVLFSKTALLGADGSIRGIVGVIFDISERKKFEQIVFENEEKFRTLAEYTHDWETWLSPEGTYLYVSPSCERITGYSADEFIDDPSLVIRITHPDDMEAIMDHYHTMPTDSSDVYHLDYRIITKSGEERWISHICQSVYRDDGTWIGRRESKRDITLRKRMEIANQQINIKLNLLSSITRHDVLNQLTALIGYTDLAQDQIDDPELKGMLNRVMETASVIAEQISFTRIYQDIGLNEPIWQEVKMTISRAMTGVRIASVEIDPSLEGVLVRADPLLEKVFFCLLDNSVRHGIRVTTARFSCRDEHDGMMLIYEDDGIGIADYDKYHIFDRGFGKNTGFGLFLAKEILAISGNSIRETGVYQQGARFEILFSKGSFRREDSEGFRSGSCQELNP